ncbi:MAG: NAD-dependent epimerase/dehydratase family protein [Bacteroidales bacterium]
MDNNICIVGGSGFIGTRLCQRLESKDRPFSIVDKKISPVFPEKTIVADVRDVDSLRKCISGEIIINLAAEHRDDVRPKSLYEEVNVGGAKNICAVADEKGINKIVFTSSVAVYGFAPIGTDETGELHPFNEYGRTKMLAEEIYKDWYNQAPQNKLLVIIRPTVVFGEGNRGNVYNLLKQMASGRFVMVGSGKNIKSMAYVENVAAFIEYSMGLRSGFYLYNYVDKPDFDMNSLVETIYKMLGKGSEIKFRIPYKIGLLGGYLFDIISKITNKKLPITSIRVKKFCSNSCFNTAVLSTGFVPPVKIYDGLEKTIKYEFLEDHKDKIVFYTE